MLEEFLLPVCICVVLPVMIVWLVMRARQNETNRKAEIMLKAIEAGVPVDMEQFKSARKAPKTLKMDLIEKLTGACITSLMGIAFVVYAILGSVAPHWVAGKMFINMAPLAGGIMIAVGIGLFISYFAGKKMLAKEIEAEEKKLTAQE